MLFKITHNVMTYLTGACLLALASSFSVFAQGDIYEENTTFHGTDILSEPGGSPAESLVSARDVRLKGSTLSGDVVAGREVQATGCRIGGTVKAGRDVVLKNCPMIGGIKAGRSVMLSGTSVSNDVMAGNRLILKNSQLKANARAGREVQLDTSSITGQLQTGAAYLLLDASEVGSILITNAGDAGNRGVFVSGGTNVTSLNGVMSISVGNSGTSSVNGYTVKGAVGQTTVITPGNVIYVNGDKVSGHGPETYAEYRARHSSVPFVQGPGWSEQGGQQPASSPEEDNLAVPTKVIELKNNSHIQGDIVFEGGGGKVILRENSTIGGQVTGGEIEEL